MTAKGLLSTEKIVLVGAGNVATFKCLAGRKNRLRR